MYCKWWSWCMIPEISSMTDIIFCHLGYFLPFYPSKQKPGKTKFWKHEKTPGNIIILHMSTMNENHMMYDSWDMERDRQICLLLYHLLPFYAPLLPHHHLTQKIKILKKSKKHQEIHHFTHEYHKWQSHDIWPLRYEVQ